jgi:hypothetical protein
LPLEDLGVQQFRNMCHPIRVFQCRVSGESIHENSAESPA